MSPRHPKLLDFYKNNGTEAGGPSCFMAVISQGSSRAQTRPDSLSLDSRVDGALCVCMCDFIFKVMGISVEFLEHNVAWHGLEAWVGTGNSGDVLVLINQWEELPVCLPMCLLICPCYRASSGRIYRLGFIAVNQVTVVLDQIKHCI